jgi:hypothetical protein
MLVERRGHRLGVGPLLRLPAAPQHRSPHDPDSDRRTGTHPLFGMRVTSLAAAASRAPRDDRALRAPRDDREVPGEPRPVCAIMAW